MEVYAAKNAPESIILFDGVCNLCNGWVRFVINRDTELKFRFASLQSKAGQRRFSKRNVSPDSFDSIVLIEEKAYYVKSTAVLRIVKKFGGLWAFCYYLFIIVPQAWRDRAYDFVAVNRYNWFGRTHHCVIPKPALGDRFLD